MLHWLRRLLGSPKTPSGQQLNRHLAEIERQAAGAAPLARARMLAEAAGQCAAADDADAALFYYGRAIDLHLEADSFHQAGVLCRRVISLSPDVVRARCTLAFVALADALRDPDAPAVAERAEREVGEYVAASRRASREDLTVKRLRLMAKATSHAQIREAIATHLMDLDDAAGANEILGAVYAERNQRQAPLADEQRRRWAEALQLAVVDRD